MKEKIRKLLPSSLINDQLYKDYEKKINKKSFINKIEKKDDDIRKLLLNNVLDFNTLRRAFEISLENELLRKFNLKLPIIFVESNTISLFVNNRIILFSDAFHITLCLLFNSYILWELNYKHLSKGYFKKLQKNIYYRNSKVQLKDLKLKQYSYVLTDKIAENELDELNLIKFERVTESLILFFLHEYAHMKYPIIKDEKKIDNIAIYHFLKKYPNNILIYPFIFFEFISSFDNSLKDRASNLSRYLESKNRDKIIKYFKEMQ